MKRTYNLGSGESCTIDLDAIAYHRNGSSGEGFYMVPMTYRGAKLDGTASDDTANLLGIVYREWTHTSVIDPQNPAAGWRGDHFRPALADAINRRNKKEWGTLGATDRLDVTWDDHINERREKAERRYINSLGA